MGLTNAACAFHATNMPAPWTKEVTPITPWTESPDISTEWTKKTIPSTT
jgi:hypothetical protein